MILRILNFHFSHKMLLCFFYSLHELDTEQTTTAAHRVITPVIISTQTDPAALCSDQHWCQATVNSV